MRCLLIGNFGVGNLGDEALRQYFIERFPEISWTVVSASSKENNEVPRLPAGVRSFFTSWWSTLHAYRSCDAVVFGGGSLLTDVESSTACFLWWWHARLAAFFRKPILLTFQGIGPFRTKRGEQWARAVAAMSAFISVRDAASAKRILAWDMNTKVVQSFDPVFSLLSAYQSTQSIKNVLAIFPRDSYDHNMVLKVQQIITSRSPTEIRFILMKPDSERPIVERMRREMGVIGTVHEADTLEHLLQFLEPVDRVITQRYHGAIAALACGKEVMIMPQAKGDKLDELQGMLRSGVQSDELLARIEAGQLALREALKVIALKQESA